MPESATEVQGGPSLEQILWRAMDRFAERPALLDAEEFAAHIEGVFAGELPAESWVARFFEGGPKAPAASMAEAIVQATRKRLAEYQFDLRQLEYVIVEDKEKVVVVSDFGQFALQNDDVVKRAVEAAVIPGEKGARGGTGPRAYLVRASGEVVAVDVKKVARSLEQLMVRQVSAPAVQKPAARLSPFGVTRRSLSEAGEIRALRQDPRTLQAVPVPARPTRPASAPAQRTALFLLLPDGSLARAGIGSATRWQEMLGGYLRALQLGGTGERALMPSQGLAAARPGADRFWIQPEAALAGGRRLAQGGSGAALGGAVVVQQVQLGQITFDPWADWALAGGSPALRSALDGAPAAANLTAPPALAQKLRALRGPGVMLAGAPVVAFRAPDASVVQGASGPLRLAARNRSGVSTGLEMSRAAPVPLAARSGALPATALAALQLALERTASAGGYRLPTLRITSAPGAVAAGAAIDLPALDPRRTSVRLAGPVSRRDRGAGQVMDLVLSMPFPAGEVHVGNDLSDALQAWLGGTVQPAPDGMPMAVRVRGEQVPAAYPLALGSPAFSGLPVLLQRALVQTGDWTAGPAASLPLSVGQVALTGPFVFGGPPTVVAVPPLQRPLHPGEEEIVIPLPLWAQMGRGQLSETGRIMASPLAPRGYAPPLGVYQLVTPSGGLVDFTAGARVGTPGSIDLSGPAALSILQRPGSGAVQAAPLTGRHLLGRLPIGAPVAPALVSPDPGLPSLGATSGSASSDSGFTARARAEGERSAADAASALAALRRTGAGVEPQAGSGAVLAGLPPGMWSGHTRASTSGDQGWSSRPFYPSLPAALRFRYVGAPPWWPSPRLGSTGEPDASSAGNPLYAGLRAASSAASIWRSILVAGANPSADDPAGEDARLDPGAAQMGSVSRRLEARPASAWVGISRSGSAGALGRSAAARARADSIEMSIVAAIPPAPPPLETMGSLPGGGGAPHARHTQQGHGAGAHGQQESDTVSHSKIEGSVDAIAQRIYHRIRRRIQSDRERFGG